MSLNILVDNVGDEKIEINQLSNRGKMKIKNLQEINKMNVIICSKRITVRIKKFKMIFRRVNFTNLSKIYHIYKLKQL